MRNEQIMEAIVAMNTNINNRLTSIEECQKTQTAELSEMKARLEVLETKKGGKKSPKVEKPKVTRDEALSQKYGLNKAGRAAFIWAKKMYASKLWKVVQEKKKEGKEYKAKDMYSYIEKKATELATQWIDSQKGSHPEWDPSYVAPEATATTAETENN